MAKRRKRKKKSGDKDAAIKTIILITAIVQLVKAITEMVETFIN